MDSTVREKPPQDAEGPRRSVQASPRTDGRETASKRAVFVDRDKTLIEDPGYINAPDQVRLLPGVAEAIRRLRQAGYLVVVASNQSGVARGLVTEAELAEIHQTMRERLRQHGCDVDAVYYCPYLDGPEAVREEYRRESDLRKPKPGMLRRAAEDLEIDLSASWMVGDSPRDVEAGRAAGCRTVLLRGAPRADDESRDAEFVAPNLAAAADYILKQTEVVIMQTQSETADTPTAEPPEALYGVSPAPRATSENLLAQMLEEMRVMRRERQYGDFSIGKLAGAIFQAFALCAVIWGLYAWMNADSASDPEAATAATIRLLCAIVFQLIALTCFTAARR